jgi:isoquinoline 1-oxidoreductase subunit beta
LLLLGRQKTKSIPELSPLQLNRRSFLASAAAVGGALTLGFRLHAAPASPGTAEITAWIVIAPDESVVIRVARSELGQGISTALPMLVAEELGCDWAKVKMELIAPSDNRRRGQVWGSMTTGASRSIAEAHERLRLAGATAREMLVAAAAQRWQVAPEECRAANGIITHVPSGRSVSFGQIASAAAQVAPPARPRLKPPRDWTLIGTPRPRLDTADKVTGRAVYGTDVRFPGMLYAAIRHAPVLGATLKSVAAPAEGGMRIVALAHAVAVVAESWWQASKAAEALAVTWDNGPHAELSSAAIEASLRAGLAASEAEVGRAGGDADAALAASVKRIEAEYAVPFLAHATMEPQNCTAYVTPDRVEVWVPTQDPEAALLTAALTAGVALENVVVHRTAVGGGFGRRVAVQDFVQEAVLIAKEVGRPVQLLWSREEDIRHDFYRPAAMARLTAGLDAAGMPAAWKVRISAPSIVASLASDVADGFDRHALDGFLEEMPYAVPNYLVDYAMCETPVPVGPWRSLNYSQNTFFKECFLDEMAHAAGSDPYVFRRKLLMHNPRHLAVLDAAARQAGWGSPLPTGMGRGIALSESHGSICAQVLEISVNVGGPRVVRVVSAIDPGHVVNPITVEMQTEGAVAFALSAALYGDIHIAGGRVRQGNFNDYPVLRLADMPRVETVIVPGGEGWGGCGEPTVPPLAPALCNAIFAATGERVRRLPVAPISDQLPVISDQRSGIGMTARESKKY